RHAAESPRSAWMAAARRPAARTSAAAASAASPDVWYARGTSQPGPPGRRAMAPPMRRVPVTSAPAMAALYSSTMRSDGSTRRGFLRQATGAGLAAAAVLTHDAHVRAKAAVDRVADRDPDD